MDIVMASADSVGKGIGGFLSNPSVFALAALGIGLFLFRDKISNFFQGGFDSIGEAFGSLGNVNITLPEINFPSIELPSFDFSNFFPENLFPNAILDDEGDVAVIPLSQPGEGLPNPADDPTNPTPFDVGIPQTEFEEGGIAVPIGANPEVTETQFGTSIVVPPGDELGFGGGPSFIGGTTTFGDNLVDTFTEALAIFPELSASQLADLLESNPGLTGSQFALIDPLGEINISSAGEDPDQTLNVSSGGFTGLTPEQIFSLISGL